MVTESFKQIVYFLHISKKSKTTYIFFICFVYFQKSKTTELSFLYNTPALYYYFLFMCSLWLHFNEEIGFQSKPISHWDFYILVLVMSNMADG